VTQPCELLVLGVVGDRDALERCAQAAGHRIAGVVGSVAEARALLAARAPGAPRPVLLIDAAIARADQDGAVRELVRSSRLPLVELVTDDPAPRLASSLDSNLVSQLVPGLADLALFAAHPGHGATVPPVSCALAPRELALAVALAVLRQDLDRADHARAEVAVTLHQREQRHQAELLRLQRVLARRAAELQAMNDELELFAFSISHDLRAPLRAIQGFSKLVLDTYEGRLDQRGQLYLMHLREASRRMAELIEDLLALSRLMRAEMHVQTCDLGAMARDILDELQQTAPERMVDISIAPVLEARGDPALLRVALEILLDNSWKFTSRKPRACIEVGAATRDGQPAYFVRDNGAGFDMAHADKLFGAFQRLHGDAFEGTGMGLAMVQRIVRRHGGDIWADAAVDRGATFTFTLS
jgi:signal transduction histidine kinase